MVGPVRVQRADPADDRVPDVHWIVRRELVAAIHEEQLHATGYICRGPDQAKRACRCSVRDFRLTDIAGNVIREIAGGGDPGAAGFAGATGAALATGRLSVGRRQMRFLGAPFGTPPPPPFSRVRQPFQRVNRLVNSGFLVLQLRQNRWKIHF